MGLVIYHNPKCSKSRQMLQFLLDRDLSPLVVKYLVDTPNASELKKILEMLNLAPREMMRVKDPLFKELNLNDQNLTSDNLLEAMVNNPKLIERPIVVNNGKAIIGRPLENVLAIL